MTNYDKFTLLVDANAIGYTWQQMGTKLRAGNLETQAAFGMLKTMRDLRETYPDARILNLWDGRAQWRYDLYPGYKSNRDATPDKRAMRESYKLQKPYIHRMFEHLGLAQITAFTHEADDMAGYFVDRWSADSRHYIGLITGDQDWLQFIRPNVFWRDLRDAARYVTARNFYSYTGCKTPLQFLQRKCLVGDSSDCIKGVGGIGETGAPEFIATHGDVREFWRKCDEGIYVPATKAERSLWKGESEYDRDQWKALYTGDAADKKALKKHMDEWPGQGRLLFRRNLQLMQLLKVTPPKPEDVKYIPGAFDKEAFAEVCEELAFVSILKDLDNFTSLFQPTT